MVHVSGAPQRSHVGSLMVPQLQRSSLVTMPPDMCIIKVPADRDVFGLIIFGQVLNWQDALGRSPFFP